MKKLLFILIFFYSTNAIAQVFLACENITYQDDLIANRYYLLESDKLTTLKAWVYSFKTGEEKGFRHFDNEQKSVRKIIKENEHHIFFDKVELDKIKGILSMKTEDGKELIFRCKIYNKDKFFLVR
tara:strand:- start:26 stop:403 length:378 start_codon:yes stop_codon:yes gene_type:complete